MANPHQYAFEYQYPPGKSVFVRAYLRHRFGKQEHVCSHYRSPPSH